MLSFVSPFCRGTARTLFYVGLLGGSVAAAQTHGRFCLGGDLQHLSSAQRSACADKLDTVRKAAQRFGAPGDWHFVMVCGEEGWKAYAPFAAHAWTALERASADTDLAARSTYFREERLTLAGADGSNERVLAREMAAAVLGTEDRAAIEARVDLWMSAATPHDGQEAPVLRASR